MFRIRNINNKQYTFSAWMLGDGANEARTESYLWYGKGVLELATSPSAKNISRVTSSACEQAGVAWR